MSVATLDDATLDALCGVLGYTVTAFTGPESSTLLRRCQIEDIAREFTKRHRLHEALAARQLRDDVSNLVIAFVQGAMHPAKYVGKSRAFNVRNSNAVLSLAGIGVDDDGRVIATQKASTASEAEAGAGRCARNWFGAGPEGADD